MDNLNRENMIRSSAKMALSGVICALAVLVMFIAAIIPSFFDYLSPGVAGVILLVLYFEFDTKTALTAFAATAIITIIIMPPKEPGLMFLFFFGFYPTMHIILQKHLKNRILRVILGLLLFNACMGFIYFLMFQIFGWSNFSDTFGNIFLAILGVMNITFLLYFYCLDSIELIYQKRIHPIVAKTFKLYR